MTSNNCFNKRLQELADVSAPSGYENSITKLLASIGAEFGFSPSVDAIGNLILKKGQGKEKTVLLLAHCDEIGMVVKHIDDRGFVFFATLGGIDESLLLGRHVQINHRGTAVPGVIGSIPTKMGGNCSLSDISSHWIDIGVSSKEDAERFISIGDSISFVSPFQELGGGLVVSKSLDNRAGIAVLFEAISRINGIDLPYNLSVVFSVQEELGSMGAIPASYSVNPDYCIAIDVTNATDYSSISPCKYGDIRLHRGAVIPVGSNLSPHIQDTLCSIAIKEGIPFQREALPGFCGTDVAQAQISRSGCHTGLISIPCRYMHSPTEIVSLLDMEAASSLLVAMLRAYSFL